MRPIPVAFHVWFIEVHTYGIGLALTFWFGLRYFERRLRSNGYPTEWVTGMFIWVIVAAIVGARVFSVVPNLSQYSSDPMQVFAIWQGGLSSFGGLIFAIPVGIIVSRRRCPEISTVRLLDLIAPVLMAAWGIGRLLGPQLMVRGGGHPTTAWFGMYYAGEVGKRLPVPIFQAIGDFAIFGILLLVERWLRSQAPRIADADGAASETGTTLTRSLPPAGIVIGVGMVLWGIERFFDEYLWLTDPSHLGFILVETAGIALSAAGLIVLATRVRPFQRWRDGETDGGERQRPKDEIVGSEDEPVGSGDTTAGSSDKAPDQPALGRS
jgi:phosphatidylglycerol:prolipoprotein diacylglycerol transferase